MKGEELRVEGVECRVYGVLCVVQGVWCMVYRHHEALDEAQVERRLASMPLKSAVF